MPKNTENTDFALKYRISTNLERKIQNAKISCLTTPVPFRLLPCDCSWRQLCEALGFEETEELQDPPAWWGLRGTFRARLHYWASKKHVIYLGFSSNSMRPCFPGEGPVLWQQRDLPGCCRLWCARLSLQAVEWTQGELRNGWTTTITTTVMDDLQMAMKFKKVTNYVEYYSWHKFVPIFSPEDFITDKYFFRYWASTLPLPQE